ncbi:MAG: RES family NAD+ phosphorylase [Betaproteobacteria bacterium]|nr:RES family NAD+ phosphorylase [Betaproteobacteria bacterium]
MSDIWAACGAQAPRVTLQCTVLRLVESQEQIATRRLVRHLDEQALLEELLETVKPPLPAPGRPKPGGAPSGGSAAWGPTPAAPAAAAAAGLHYLLYTPFRYPPLRHGSRFGRRFEPSLFYGALEPDTVLAESAYYRFVFWEGMETPPATTLRTEHTLFGAACRSRHALRLHEPPFDAWREALVSRTDYRATQQLGSALREAGIEAIEYVSARDPAGGIAVALFTPGALAAKRPVFSQQWLGETDGAQVRFFCPEERTVVRFGRGDFEVAGALPLPAG